MALIGSWLWITRRPTAPTRCWRGTRSMNGSRCCGSRKTLVALVVSRRGWGAARGMGADFLWIMDDDCYPNPDALEELINGLGKAQQTLGAQPPYACSVVKWTDGSICEMNNPGTT